MNNNYKILQLHHSFSSAEVTAFEDYLNSPFFNKDTRFVALYHYIKSTPTNKFSKQQFFAAAGDSLTYNDDLCRKWMSILTQYAEDFLATNEILNNQPLLQQSKLAPLRRMGLSKHFKQSYNVAVKSLDDSHRDAGYFLGSYKLEQELQEQRATEQGRNNQPDYTKAISMVDTYWLLEKLRYACEILNAKNIVALKTEVPLLDEMIAYVNNSPTEHSTGVLIYYQILMTLIEPENSNYYYKLKELLLTNHHLFSAEEARSMMVFTQNYCIRSINRGKAQFLTELFDLYKIGLESRISFEQGYVTPWTLKNVVNIALRLNDHVWAEQAIKTYANQLQPKHKQNALTFNMARLHLNKNEFRKTVKLLQQVEYNDVFYGMDSRVLLLKAYYELNEVEAMDSLIDSFRLAIRRNKQLSQGHKENFLNLVKFIKKLVRLSPFQKKKIEHLKTQIESTENVADKSWLLEKIKELNRD